jgi:hypothetical protein
MIAKSDAACTTSDAAYTSKTRGEDGEIPRAARSCTAKYRTYHQGREENEEQNRPGIPANLGPHRKNETMGKTCRAACLLPKVTVMLRGSCDCCMNHRLLARHPQGHHIPWRHHHQTSHGGPPLRAGRGGAHGCITPPVHHPVRNNGAWHMIAMQRGEMIIYTSACRDVSELCYQNSYALFMLSWQSARDIHMQKALEK